MGFTYNLQTGINFRTEFSFLDSLLGLNFVGSFAFVLFFG